MGLFSVRKVYGIRDCVDGSSNTVAFSEILVGLSTIPKYRGNGTLTGGATGVIDAWQNPTTVTTDLTSCNTAFMAASNISSLPGQNWLYGDQAITLFNTVVPPSSTQYKWTSCRGNCAGCWPDGSQYVNAASNHSGGVNVLMGDGSVKFIKSSIAQNTWWSIGTRASGEVVGSDAY